MRLPFVLTIVLVVGASHLLLAAEPKGPKTSAPYNPAISPASGEGEAAIKRFEFDKSLMLELWAAEPMLANPVSFCFDGKGRCFVAETFRMKAGVTDNRDHNWLEDDLACRTVDDRVKMYRKYAKDKFEQSYLRERDRIRLLEDTTGSGKADRATVFCDDFGKADDGIAAGVLARPGSVYVTNIPSLYQLKEPQASGGAVAKEVLSTGFGVHVSFFGHDMHGLRMGPDGRLYFSIGDRGFNVTTKEGKHLNYPDTGAVLRCNLDGANLEVVHIGLRNPQELAFDDYGNLFTIDNNSDSGDKARFVYIVEGGDSGWRIGYQYGSSMHDSTVKQGNRGPWNYEKLWHPHHEGQPAYIVPTYTHLSDGPSGICHYPGVGLSEKYKGHFFVCDFRGNSSGSGVWSFATKPKGAGFELVDPKHFVWNVLATDCDFGPDGALYISDWTEGWNKPGKGRLYKVSDPEARKNDIVMESKKLLSEGFSERPIGSLVELLAHPHQQVRMEAQYALAAKGKDAIEPLTKVAKESKNQLARLHAIWGLGQLRSKHAEIDPSLIDLSDDEDAEVRAQTAKMMVGIPSVPQLPSAVIQRLIVLLKDPEPRVKFFAAQSLGTFQWKGASDRLLLVGVRFALLGLLAENAEKDPYLRHAASRALATTIERPDDFKVTSEASPASRKAAVLVYRHLLHTLNGAAKDEMVRARLVPLLADTDPLVASEAARAIHDENVVSAYAALGNISNNVSVPVTVLYRALNAHYRLGKAENAVALANFAGRADAPANLRMLALQMLGSWAVPPRRDFITGLTQDLAARDASVAADALKAKLGGIFSGPASVQKEAANVAGKLGITEVGPFLLALVTDAKALSSTRVQAIDALDALKDKRLPEAVTAAIGSNDPRLRNAGRAILLKTKPAQVVQQLKEVFAKDDVVEKQGAFALLAGIESTEAEDMLATWLDKLNKKEVPAELQLDILEAGAKRNNARLNALLKSYDEALPKGDELAAWRETLRGGDAARGRDIFLNKSAVSCQRCHKLDGEGGEVGPPLNGLAAKQNRDYLLEAIVLPNKQIAKGYESVLITKTDGKTVNGVLKSEDAKEVRLMTAEGQLIAVLKDDIEERRATKTAMPEDVVQKLTKQELRDLVEFLAGLKEEWKK